MANCWCSQITPGTYSAALPSSIGSSIQRSPYLTAVGGYVPPHAFFLFSGQP